MAVRSDSILVARLQDLSRLAAAAAIAIGCLVMIGWLFNIETFKSVLPGLVTMKFNPALAYTVAGIGLFNLRGRPRIAQAAAIAIILLGLLTLSEYVFGWDLGIDQFIIRDTQTAVTAFPGRMAVIAAVNLCLVGSALLLLARTRRYRLAQLLTLIAAVFALLAIVGYLYNAQELYQVFPYSNLALHAAVTFVLLCLGLLTAYPDQGLMAILSRSSAGGYMARRLLPLAVLIPMVVGWLRWQGELRGLYGTGFGLTLFTLSNIIIFSVVIIWTARTLHTTDVERSNALDALRLVNEQLEARVQERTTHLTATIKEMEAFSYSVSHDLRTPLRALDGYAQVLIDDYAGVLDNEGKRYLGRIRTATQRMGHLIDGLLQLSHTSRAEMAHEPVNLSKLARDVAAELSKIQPEREVQVIIADDLVVEGDAELLRVALQNLIGNAWKFTRGQSHPRIELGVTQYNGRQVYFVRDNGVGFDMTYVHKLFRAFQRLHKIEEFEGTGIGLATLQRIIQRHGGEVWAEGTVDRGATFYFTL